MKWHQLISGAAGVLALVLVACSDAGTAPGAGGGTGGSGGGTGGSGGSGGGTGGSGGGSCPILEDVLADVQSHLDDLVATAYFLGGHPGPSEATGFLLAPGLPAPPAVSAVYATLIAECVDPMSYDPYCDGEVCSQIECTGADAGWILHHWLEAPGAFGDWSFDSVEVDVAWADGATGITFAIAVQATGPSARDWAMQGTGSMDTDLLEVSEELGLLFDAGPATLTYHSTPTSSTGTLAVGTLVVAEADANGHLAPTGACP